MAEAAIGFAASIAGLASFGIQIATTLNTFAISYTRAEQQIRDLAADVALTASILESIGKMIKEYEDRFHLTVDNYIETRDRCESNFNTLWIAVKAVKKGESEKPKVKGEYRIGGQMGVWPKMMHAMGGADALRHLVLSINTSKSNLQLLLGSLNFLILKNLSRNNLLSEDQSADFKLFMRQLPALVLGLREAGLMKDHEEKAKSVKDAGTGIVHVGLADSHPGAKPNDPPGDGNHIAIINANTENGGEDSTSAIQKSAHFNKPEITEDHQSKADLTTSPLHELGAVPQHSIPTPEILPESGDSNDTHSLYEGWLLEQDNSAVTAKVAVLCGLKLKVYSETFPQDKYSIVPFSRDKKKLKSRMEEFGRKHDQIESQAKARIEHLLEDLDKSAQQEIEKLLNDRNFSATEPYGWKIAAIGDLLYEGKSDRRAFWRQRREARKSRRCLIILRGGVIDSEEDESDDLPTRLSNPWREELVFSRSREEKYQKRLEADLRKAGMEERQISVVLKKEPGIDAKRPTYTRMSRKHLSLETLAKFRIDYVLDEDPDWVLIKRWVPDHEQDVLWNHTREIRERRQPVLVAIEGKKKHGDVEFEFVRKRHKRQQPPSTLLSFLAGGRKGTQSHRSHSESWETQSSESDANSAAGQEHIAQEDSGPDDAHPLSEEEAEALMDEFLATFTSSNQ